MLNSRNSRLKNGFTLIELHFAIAIVGIISVASSQFVQLNAVRVHHDTPTSDCSTTLTIYGDAGGNDVLSHETVTMGDGSVRKITWGDGTTDHDPKSVYAVITKTVNNPSNNLPAVQSCRPGEIFATMELMDRATNQTILVLPGIEKLPAVQ